MRATPWRRQEAKRRLRELVNESLVLRRTPTNCNSRVHGLGALHRVAKSNRGSSTSACRGRSQRAVARDGAAPRCMPPRPVQRARTVSAGTRSLYHATRAHFSTIWACCCKPPRPSRARHRAGRYVPCATRNRTRAALVAWSFDERDVPTRASRDDHGGLSQRQTARSASAGSCAARAELGSPHRQRGRTSWR
jgi:hypothetical protein